MSAHTEGRLSFKQFDQTCDLEREDGTPIAVGLSAADARRMVACWNACEGFDTDLLVNIDTMGDTLAQRFHGLRAEFGVQQQKLADTIVERDQLRAANDDLLSTGEKVLDRAECITAELAAARALLCEVLKADDDDHYSEGSIIGHLTERIRSLLKGEPVADNITRAEVVDAAATAVGLALGAGMVLTVWQKPCLPLAMGNYDTVVEVRPARVMAEKGSAA